MANRFIRKRGDNSTVQPKTSLQPASNVIFSTTLGNLKRSRRPDASVARIEAQHDLPQADQVPPTILFWLDLQSHRSHPPDLHGRASAPVQPQHTYISRQQTCSRVLLCRRIFALMILEALHRIVNHREALSREEARQV